MNTCIPLRLLSWGRVDKRGQHREQKQSLRRMEGLYKAGKTQVSSTYVSYTTLIDAYAKQCSASFSAADAEAAEALLLQMEEAGGCCAKDEGFHNNNNNNSIRPNHISYSAVIDAWGKCRGEGSAKRAGALLRRMQQKYDEGDESVRPSGVTYTAVINAIAKTYDYPNKA